jgi:hypothetical protein
MFSGHRPTDHYDEHQDRDRVTDERLLDQDEKRPDASDEARCGYGPLSSRRSTSPIRGSVDHRKHGQKYDG